MTFEKKKCTTQILIMILHEKKKNVYLRNRIIINAHFC